MSERTEMGTDRPKLHTRLAEMCQISALSELLVAAQAPCYLGANIAK